MYTEYLENREAIVNNKHTPSLPSMSYNRKDTECIHFLTYPAHDNSCIIKFIKN